MLYAKVGVDKTVTFGPVLAADGTMSSGALAYTDAKIFKNGTDGALNSSATFTHKYEGVYALLLKAADLDAVGLYEVVLNKNPLSASPVKITVLAANVYDWLFGTVAPSTLTQTNISGGAYDLTNATFIAALKSGLGTLPASGNWSTYAGADTAGTTTLLARIPQVVSMAQVGGTGAYFVEALTDGGSHIHVSGAAVAKSPATLDWSADVTNKPTIGTSTLTQSQVTGGAYDMTNSSCIVHASGNWNTVAPDNADIALIKAQTDKLATALKPA